MIETFEPMEPKEGTRFSNFKNKIIERIKINDGFCPCVTERNEDTLCPCKDYRENSGCHCSLYIK